MRRRDFLRLVGMGGAAVALGPGDALAVTPAWGDYPTALKSLALPVNKRAKNVLEFFMYGGVSPWETFYCVDDPAFGKAKSWFVWSFVGGSYDLVAAQKACFGSTVKLSEPFTVDANGVKVGLGPMVMPLRARPDITARMRLHVIDHDVMPHQAAYPLAVSGYRVGSPKMAGVGTHVQRYFQTHAKAPSKEPHAFVLRTNHRAEQASAAASAPGLHPGSARPLVLALSGNQAFVHALKRLNLGKQPQARDQLVSYYADQYRRRMVPKGAQLAARAALMDDYLYSLYGLQNHSAGLAATLKPELFKDVAGASCGYKAEVADTVRDLKIAVHLLRRPGSEVRHVTVFDAGLSHSPEDFGHDTHSGHTKHATVNYNYSLGALCNVINKPGENNPGKLDLDETLVVINTEFGRTPWTQGPDGRNHFPSGYVTAMFGGPIGKPQKGLVGAIGSDALVKGALHPAETRAATLVALGIYPFLEEGYAVSEVNGVKNEAEAVKKLREVVLGA